MNQLSRGFVVIVFLLLETVAIGPPERGGILPLGPNLFEGQVVGFAAAESVGPRPVRFVASFIVEIDILLSRGRLVQVIRDEPRAVFPPQRPLLLRFGGKAVDPHEVGMVAVGDFAPPLEIVLHEVRGKLKRSIERGGRRLTANFLGDRGVGRAAERALLGEEPVMPFAVERDAVFQARIANRRPEQTDEVLARTLLNRIPWREGAVPEREAVVVLASENHVARARAAKQARPRRGVEAFGAEEWHEILVAEIRRRRAEALLEERGVFRGIARAVAGAIHELREVLRVVVARAEAGDAVNSPVNQDAEFRVVEPRGHGDVPQRVPVRFVAGGGRCGGEGGCQRQRGQDDCEQRSRSPAKRAAARRRRNGTMAGVVRHFIFFIFFRLVRSMRAGAGKPSRRMRTPACSSAATSAG